MRHPKAQAISLFLLILLSLGPGMAAAQQGCSANVTEYGDYTLVYELDVPGGNANYDNALPPYSVDNAAGVDTFDRVAYCLELDTGSGLQWTWVSMDAFTAEAGKLGVPVLATGAHFDQAPGLDVPLQLGNLLGAAQPPGLRADGIEL